MKEYEGLVNRLKEANEQPDFDQLFLSVKDKIYASQRRRLTLAGSLAVLLIGFVAYFTFVIPQVRGDMLMTYVFEKENDNGALFSYVFED